MCTYYQTAKEQFYTPGLQVIYLNGFFNTKKGKGVNFQQNTKHII